ncbi:MAG TPA: acyltransferase [Opitutaceae bacterium]|jgi:peptidoglycan/LPS O-acetylase OafA/YrhL
MPSVRLELPAPVTGRIGALDEAKGVALLLIILYHVTPVFGLSYTPHGEIGVDMFVILSGIGIGFGASKAGAARFLVRRLWRIYPAYWMVLTLFLAGGVFVLGQRFSMTDIALHYLGIQSWFGNFYAMSINDSFWFVTLIVSLYVLYVVLRPIARRPDQLLFWSFLVSLVLAVYYYRTNQLIGFDHMSHRMPGFFLGILAGRLMREGRLDLPLSPWFGAALVLLFYVAFTQKFVFASVWVGVGLLAGYAFLVRPFFGTGLRGVLAFLGVRSFEIYLLHQPLVREYNVWALQHLMPGGVPGMGAKIVGTTVGLAVAILLAGGLRALLARLPAPALARPAV